MSRIRIIAGAIVLVAASPANAAEPNYVGVWASNRAQCKVAQDRPNAPMAVRANGYDQHEAHCTFTSVKSVWRTWKIQSACSIQGDKQNLAHQFKVRGNRLVMTQGKVVRPLVRC